MKIQQRISALTKLGEEIFSFLQGERKNSFLGPAIKGSFIHNGWFTEENVRYALSAICEMLNEKQILKFLRNYQNLKSANLEYGTGNIKNQKNIGVIMPSNIPLAGFHDFFCVLLSGNIFVGKCSVQDKILLPAISKMLTDIDPLFKKYIFFVENKLEKIDAVIATGSNNSARYFEYYFGKYPHIIRKNRNSVALLTSNETEEELTLLANDIFRYFGLGCRNVSKIFVPLNYDFKFFFKAIFGWNDIIHHNKYANNYSYNKAVYLMNKIKIWDNGFLLLKEDNGLSSPVAVLFYEYYQHGKQLNERLKSEQENIQCIISKNHIPFGRAQHPELRDFSDRIDTMEFLMNL